jgi:hypothetical protein
MEPEGSLPCPQSHLLASILSQTKPVHTCEIWGSHGADNNDDVLGLGLGAVWIGW